MSDGQWKPLVRRFLNSIPNDMTILGYKTVEVENVDESLCWHIYAPGSPEGGLPLIRLSYGVIYDISTIKHDPNLMNALAACLCYIGLPSPEIVEKIFIKFPGLSGLPIHKYCKWAMKHSEWAVKDGKPKKSAARNSSKTKTSNKEKKENDNKTGKNVRKSKEIKKHEEIEEIVDIDEGHDDFEDDQQIDRDPELVFEVVPISNKRRKLNL